MTAEVIILPVIRRLSDGQVVTRHCSLDTSIDNKLRAAAKMANCRPEHMIEALVVYGLAAIEKKPVEAFILANEVECAKARDDGERTDTPTAQSLPEVNL